jgi:hypothetical protein
LYRRYPALFLVLAAGVVVPYGVIVLATTGTGSLTAGSLSVSADLLLELLNWSLITPLISALHIHAVADVREGRDPRVPTIALRGLRALPVVAAASIISTLGIILGFLAFVVPGVFLSLRWSVVAQVAAIEREGWLPALRRSHQLTKGHYGHVFVFLAFVFVILFVPSFLIGLGFDDHTTTAASFLVGLAVAVFTLSFGALATALLYYDLRARFHPAVAPESPPIGDRPDRGSAPVTHSWDPSAYPDQDRPKGWYVDPSSPNRMRYWGAGDPADWGATTRTPRKVRRAWAQAQEGD